MKKILILASTATIAMALAAPPSMASDVGQDVKNVGKHMQNWVKRTADRNRGWVMDKARDVDVPKVADRALTVKPKN